MLLFDHSGRHLALATLELAVKSGFRPFARQGVSGESLLGRWSNGAGHSTMTILCEAALRA